MNAPHSKMYATSNTFAILLLAGCVLTTTLAGCATVVTESTAIEAFAHELSNRNFAGLRRHSSPEFAAAALRNPKSVEDLERLHVPTGEVNVVDIKEVSETERKVTAEVGKKKKKVLFQLVKKPGTSEWVIDEIYMRRKQQGEIVSKPVTEQMDLLMAVREFLSTWTTGDRKDVLRSVGPELKMQLEEMSPRILARTAARIASKENLAQKFRPIAEINGSHALVRLPRRSGQLAISMNYDPNADRWYVDDLAIESKDELERVTSLKKYAAITNSATQFLAQYREGNRLELAKYSTSNFFKTTLSGADLSLVDLPGSDEILTNPEVKSKDGKADYVITTAKEMVRLSLTQEKKKQRSQVASSVKYRVNDVTIYQIDGKQEKNLSAVLLSGTMVSLFYESVIKNDLQMLTHISTNDFQTNVWSRLDKDNIKLLTMKEFEKTAPKLLATTFSGPRTQMTMSQGKHVLTYVLEQQNNRILVDDVIVTSTEMPVSLKEKLTISAPILALASAISRKDLDKVRRLSSRDFNRRIWSQTKTTNDIEMNLIPFLTAKLNRFQIQDNEAIAFLGDGENGAKIHFLKEGTQFKFSDAFLVDNQQPNQMVSLKQTMRNTIAYRQQMNPKFQKIQNVNYEKAEPLMISNDSAVSHANLEWNTQPTSKQPTPESNPQRNPQRNPEPRKLSPRISATPLHRETTSLQQKLDTEKAEPLSATMPATMPATALPPRMQSQQIIQAAPQTPIRQMPILQMKVESPGKLNQLEGMDFGGSSPKQAKKSYKPNPKSVSPPPSSSPARNSAKGFLRSAEEELTTPISLGF